MSAERLQKILARAGVGSRRAAEELIREGRVTVDGRVATLGQSVDPETASIKVDGRRVRPHEGEPRYLLVNKPRGQVSTVSDPEGRPTVVDLVPHRLRHGLKPVGRLDYDTEGLILLTDDGELANRVAHPRYGCRKTYEVKVRGRPAEAALERLRSGIVLSGRRTAPAEITPQAGPEGPRKATENSWFSVVLGEGRRRQIREMFQRIGHPVMRLRRVAIGPLSDPHLPLGGWRELTAREVEALRRSTVPGRKRAVRKSPGTQATPRRPARKGAARKGVSRKGAPRKGAPRKGAPRKDAPRKGAPRKGAPRKGAPRKGAPRKGAPRKGAPRKGAPRKGAPRKGSPGKNTRRVGPGVDSRRRRPAAAKPKGRRPRRTRS